MEDRGYLRHEQYAGGERLGARIDLHRRFSTRTDSWFAWVFDRVVRTAPRWVLDIGCGTGALWTENRARVPPDWEVVLADFAPKMARAARETGRTCLCADVQALPFSSGAFDTVLANHMLYHAPRIDEALAELHRVLRPGGTLLASTNARGSARELVALMPEPPGHAERFGLESGATRLEAVFAKVDVERRENALRIDDADAVVRYIASLPGATPEVLDRVRDTVQERIDADGVFEVRIVSGLLTART